MICSEWFEFMNNYRLFSENKTAETRKILHLSSYARKHLKFMLHIYKILRTASNKKQIKPWPKHLWSVWRDQKGRKGERRIIILHMGPYFLILPKLEGNWDDNEECCVFTNLPLIHLIFKIIVFFETGNTKIQIPFSFILILWKKKGNGEIHISSSYFFIPLTKNISWNIIISSFLYLISNEIL